MNSRVPRNNAEFMAHFNCFKKWVLAFTVIDEPRAIDPVNWPPEFWWSCCCIQLRGIKNLEDHRIS